MRFYLLAALFFICPPAHAGFTTCPSATAQDAKQVQALNFLRALAGHFRVGACDVEIHVCETPSAETSAPVAESSGEPVVGETVIDSIVGDILVTDKFGVQSYVPLYFPSESEKGAGVKIETGRLVFHYEFRDRHTDPQAGRTEAIFFEIVKRKRNAVIRRLEAGMYTTKSYQERGRKYDTRWTVCEGAAPKIDVAPVEIRQR